MLTSAALRGLLDATPSAIACFDATLRTVYANTAFTTMTGVQSGRPLEEETLAPSRARDARRQRRAAPGAARRPRPDAGVRDAVPLDEGLIGMVARRRRARGAGRARRRAVGAAAGRDAGRRRAPSPRRSSPPWPRRRGGCCTRARRPRSATRTATRSPSGGGRDDDLGGFEIGTSVPLAGSEGLTAIVARTGAPARIEDYTRRARARRRADARARLPLRGRGADRRRRRGPGGCCLVASAGSLGAGRRAPAGGVRRARRARAGERRGARRAERVAASGSWRRA